MNPKKNFFDGLRSCFLNFEVQKQTSKLIFQLRNSKFFELRSLKYNFEFSFLNFEVEKSTSKLIFELRS